MNDKALRKFSKILVVLFFDVLIATLFIKYGYFTGEAAILFYWIYYLGLIIILGILTGITVGIWIKDKKVTRITLGFLSAVFSIPLMFLLGTQIVVNYWK